MSASSRRIDRLKATFDHGGIVANAGLVVPATLMVRLGLEALIDAWVKTGSSRPGRKVLTLVAAMLAGATHIDHVNVLRAGATQRVLPFKVMAPSTIGSFLRSFTFGHVRQLDAVLSRTLGRARAAGAGPGDGPLIVDLDSTICEVHGKHKQGAAHGYTKRLGYHPLVATRRGDRRDLVLPDAERLGGVFSRDHRVRQPTRRQPAPDRRDRAGHRARRFRVLVLGTRRPAQRPRHRVVDHGHQPRRCPSSNPSDPRRRMGRHRLHPQRSGPGRRDHPHRRPRPQETQHQTGLAWSCAGPGSPDTAQQRLWPEWRHHAFITNTALDTVAADAFHRQHAVVELAIRDLKEGAGADHIPSGHYHANAAWLACAVLTHNLGCWSTQLAGQPPVTNRTRRTRLIAVPAVIVNRSGRTLLRFPARRPWARAFNTVLNALRALPAPSG